MTKKEVSNLEPQPTNRRVVGMRLSALVEAAVLLGILLLISHYFGGGHRFINISPHPFWAVVLLVTVQYGCLEGIATAFMATLALYVGNMPTQQFDETLFDYQIRIATIPFLWFVAAFILGEMRLRVENQKIQLASQLADLTDQATTVHNAYQKLKATKEHQDRLLASQRKTVASIYTSFKYLEALSPSQILMDLDKIFDMALGPKKFSVYAVGPNGFEVATSHGWKESDHFLRRITMDMPLYHAIGVERRLVTAVDPKDETILGNEGVVAGPLFDPHTNLLLGMVKIEDVDFLEFNINTIESFKALCEIIGLAYAHARRFRLLERQALYSDVKGAYSTIFLKEQRQYLERMCQAKGDALAALSIQGTETTNPAIEEALVKQLNALTQPVGQVCRAGREPLHYMILLPQTSQEEATELASKLLTSIQQDDKLSLLKISQKVELLVEAQAQPHPTTVKS